MKKLIDKKFKEFRQIYAEEKKLAKKYYIEIIKYLKEVKKHDILERESVQPIYFIENIARKIQECQRRMYDSRKKYEEYRDLVLKIESEILRNMKK